MQTAIQNGVMDAIVHDSTETTTCTCTGDIKKCMKRITTSLGLSALSRRFLGPEMNSKAKENIESKKEDGRKVYS